MVAPDLVLLNGKIVTVDPKESIVQALAVKFGRILSSGSGDDVEPMIGRETRVIDLKGRTVLPGFIDTHGHMFQSAARRDLLDCSEEAGVTSINELQRRIAERVRMTPKGQWIQGNKIDEYKLAERRRPNRWDLDIAAPENPVYLTEVGGHVAIANSMAFALRGITKDTRDPTTAPMGRFDRDPKTGELTGIMYESGAFSQVRPALNYEGLDEGIKWMGYRFAAAGITCFYDAYVNGEAVKAYLKVFGKGELPIRVRWDMDWETLMPDIEKMGFIVPPGFGNDWLKMVGLKVISTDGAISNRTAYLRKPYLNRKGYRGELKIPKEDLMGIVMKIHESGLRASVHANGDQAIINYLDAVEEAMRKHPRDNHRHRVIHCSIVDPDIIGRIKELEVLPTIFGPYAYYHGDKILPAFGQDRAEWMFAARSMLDAGIKVAAHSDYEASPYPPLMGIHALVNRTTKAGKPYGIGQRISVMEAIKLYTINAAYQTFEEDVMGSLEPGKFADMVVLGKDILTIQKETIVDIPIDMTIVGGRIIYQRNRQSSND